MQVEEIFIYPIKSLRGVNLSSCEVDISGLNLDRIFMLVDDKHEFLTQRKFPKLAEITVTINQNYLYLQSPSNQLILDLNTPPIGKTIQSKIWKDDVQGNWVSEEADEFFSQFLQTKVHLIKKTNTRIHTTQSGNTVPSSFADGLPVLVIDTGSLAYIQEVFPNIFEMENFRPNLVISSGLAFIEDKTKALEIGTTLFKFEKKCARCSMINVNPKTGHVNKEVLKCLAKIRSHDNKVFFGSLYIPQSKGLIQVKDQINPIFEPS
ncbi:MAG: MOSC domain-containing protein [Bacteroidota bacterium]